MPSILILQLERSHGAGELARTLAASGDTSFAVLCTSAAQLPDPAWTARFDAVAVLDAPRGDHSGLTDGKLVEWFADPVARGQPILAEGRAAAAATRAVGGATRDGAATRAWVRATPCAEAVEATDASFKVLLTQGTELEPPTDSAVLVHDARQRPLAYRRGALWCTAFMCNLPRIAANRLLSDYLGAGPAPTPRVQTTAELDDGALRFAAANAALLAWLVGQWRPART